MPYRQISVHIHPGRNLGFLTVVARTRGGGRDRDNLILRRSLPACTGGETVDELLALAVQCLEQAADAL